MISTLTQPIARYIDQTNVNPNATQGEIRNFIEEAKAYDFCCVAIMPLWVPMATRILEGSNTGVIAPIGYPMGTSSSKSKRAETEWAVKHGPKNIEIDMVMNTSMLRSRRYKEVEEEILSVIEAADGRLVKVIIETPLLSQDEIVIASMLVEKAGADFVKTSTGYKILPGMRPSNIQDVKLIKSVVGDRVGVKVSGGVRTVEQVLEFINAGVFRIGTSSGVSIVESYRSLIS